MENSCPRLHISKDFVKKLEIFKILISKYEDEIYNDIIKNDSKTYLKTKPDTFSKVNGSNRN